ncbi:hypothetical protein ABTN55_21025, partial [Acinetobacter baumannii]
RVAIAICFSFRVILPPRPLGIAIDWPAAAAGAAPLVDELPQPVDDAGGGELVDGCGVGGVDALSPPQDAAAGVDEGTHPE